MIAASDAYRGETVKAVIVLHDAAGGRVSTADVIEWSEARMAAYKFPRLVEFVVELSRLVTGKIAWRQLQEARRAKDALFQRHSRWSLPRMVSTLQRTSAGDR